MPTNDPRASAATEEGDHLFDYALLRDWVGFALRSPRRHGGLAIACFAAIVGLTALALHVVPYRYEVQARVLVTSTLLMNSLTNPGLNRDWDLPTRATREVVLRRDNLVALVRQTNFVDGYLRTRAPAVRAVHWVREELTHKPSHADLEDSLVDALEKRLWVNANPGDGTIDFTLQWSDPGLAYTMVSAAIESFLEARQASEISVTKETIGILEANDARVVEAITSATKRLEDKERASRNRVSLSRRRVFPSTPRDDDLAQLQSQLALRQRALRELEEFRQRRLVELQAQLAQQLPIYAPQHPSILSTRLAIETLSTPPPQTKALQDEVSELQMQIVRRGGRPEARPTADVYAQVQAELAEARLRTLDEDPRFELERSHLQLLLNQHTYLQSRIDAARVEMDTARAAFKYRYVVARPPQFPRGPIKPKPLLVLLGGLVGGVVFSLFTCTLVDLRGGRLVEAWQMQRRSGLPLLAEIRR